MGKGTCDKLSDRDGGDKNDACIEKQRAQHRLADTMWKNDEGGRTISIQGRGNKAQLRQISFTSWDEL